MILPHKTKKTLSDPLYGSTPLTEVEVNVIDCQVFQRLRNVRQLGLMDLVFPSADYSRFAHSVGACHVLGMVLESLPLKSKLEPDEWQELRLAMLLHDIGHYPMSHATEKAAEKWYKNQPVKESGGEISVEPDGGYVNHEQVGKRVLLYDEELGKALEGFDRDRIGGIFAREQDSPLKNLVSSELDADRLDYLMRSSQATGLPYGNYDRDYLIQNLVLDDQGQVCLKAKALRSADHYLMCRAFDYLQTIFHKTVVGLEQMLQHCVLAGLDNNYLTLSESDIARAIRSSDWISWDDGWLMAKLSEMELGLATSNAKVASMANRIRLRRPPPCLWQHESLSLHADADRVKAEVASFIEDDIATDAEVKDWIITWRKVFTPTDMSPSQHVRISNDEESETASKLIRILEPNGSSKPLILLNNSLMKVLSERSYVFGRVYFVGPPEGLEKVSRKVAEIASEHNQLEGLINRT